MKTEGRKRVKIEGDVPDLPPKLEYIIRRLIWFGAPKAPGLLLYFVQKMWKQFNEVNNVHQ